MTVQRVEPKNAQCMAFLFHYQNIQETRQKQCRNKMSQHQTATRVAIGVAIFFVLKNVTTIFLLAKGGRSYLENLSDELQFTAAILNQPRRKPRTDPEEDS